jgi:hypothetical protein
MLGSLATVLSWTVGPARHGDVALANVMNNLSGDVLAWRRGGTLWDR